MSTTTAIKSGGSRVQSVDLLRGLIVFLVALDILRYFIFAGYDEPTNLEGTTAPLFFTRWITHFFVPGYLLLAGVGAYLKGQALADKKKLAVFLLTRGVFVILLEIFVVGFLWTFQFNLYPILIQFVWALGASMIVLAGLLWLPLRVIAGLSLAILFGHNLLDGFSFGEGYAANILNGLFHTPAVVCAQMCESSKDVFYAYLSYPIIPWAAVMSLGYALGRVFEMTPERRRKILLYGGLSAVILFIAVRFLNGYGSPYPWSPQDNGLWTVMSFLNAKKYPPSLTYLLMTLGPLLMVLSVLENVRGWFADMVRVFGRVPLFFYFLQFLLAHVLALVLGVAQGFPVEAFMEPPWRLPETFGVSLPWVYVAFVAEVALMYPFCEWYAEVRAKKGHRFLQYF